MQNNKHNQQMGKWKVAPQRKDSGKFSDRWHYKKLKETWRKKGLTFLVMSSHWVPLPEAGAPDIIIFKCSGFADATTFT